jgi:hypothetical protein
MNTPGRRRGVLRLFHKGQITPSAQRKPLQRKKISREEPRDVGVAFNDGVLGGRGGSSLLQ